MKDISETVRQHRDFMKSLFGRADYVSDQQKKIKQPPLAKAAGDGEKIKLTRSFEGSIAQNDYTALINERVSSRVFSKTPLTTGQVAFLLWSTQGVKSVSEDSYRTMRTVPSAGARHPFEVYVAALNVEGLPKAVYHYLALTHELEFIKADERLEDKIAAALSGQLWTSKAGAIFIYSAVPYRSEWRYSIASHKVMLLDAGHAAENLYLSAHAIGGGACAIASYDQEALDSLLGLDGVDEFSVYAVPVGVV
jgi:SagB-type dehydrogenase family enzyme